MIEKMKKLTFLVTANEYEGFLEKLQDVGVVHVSQLQQGATNPTLQAAMQEDKRYAEALSNMAFAESEYANEYKDADVKDKALPADAGGCDVLNEVESLKEKENATKHKLDAAADNVAALEPWGEFSWNTLEKLALTGKKVWFFRVAPKMFKKEWQDDYFATIISEDDRHSYFIAFAEEQPEISAEHMELPKQSLSVYKEEVNRLKDEIADIHSRLYAIALYNKDQLLEARVDNENTIDINKVRLSTDSIADDAVKLMCGWVQEKDEEKIRQMLDSNKIFYMIEKPAFEDDVPVQLTNGSYSSLFEPILKMYSLPSYQDLDVTPFLAPFFMLFFGLCMGDAGYGLIILAASIILYGKLKPAQKGYGKLGMFLGGTTLVVGLLTGSFFGIDLTQQDWAFLAPVKKYFINENNFQLFGYSPMMVISVIIGLIQVLFGMVLAASKAIKNYGWQYGIGKLSWVVAIIAAIACFGLPACGVALPAFVTYILYGLIGISVLGIFFYNSPKKNPFFNFGVGLWNTYGMATGLLGDLLSYIRLFALGLTGGVLGGVFNQLAIDLTSSMSWAVRWLPMLLILLAGHGINFGLCMISSFVHPMRLTFVEFFKNADFAGGGKQYDPFRKKKYEAQ